MSLKIRAEEFRSKKTHGSKGPEICIHVYISEERERKKQRLRGVERENKMA